MTAKLFNSRTEELDYGLTPNYKAHMMKNIEWGAVAYLSHSQYGKEGEIWINPSRIIIQGVLVIHRIQKKHMAVYIIITMILV